MPRHILNEVREPMPPWLAGYQPGMIESPSGGPNAIESFLQSRIAFYPGSGVVDGELFETFTTAHAAHCVLHADQMRPASLVSEMMSRKFRPHIHVFGYRSLEVMVWDADKTRALLGLIQSHPFDQDPKLRGACWVVLERESDRTDAHGPSRLAFLHVQCEAVWLFWNLWVRGRRPGPFGILLQDHGFGGNWTYFGRNGALHQSAEQSGRLPEWLLSTQDSAWPGYRRLTESSPRRSIRLPTALEMGESAVIGGRALYAKDDVGNFEEEPKGFGDIDWLEMTSCDDEIDGHPASQAPEMTCLAYPYSPRRVYFAYGSNLDPVQFHQRCPKSEILGLATLRDHRWYITERGVASVKPDPGSLVYGILARLTENDEKLLDTHEGIHLGLYRREFVTVDVANGGQVTALIYISSDTGVGTPRFGYLERVLSGARHHSLPEKVIAELASWAEKGPKPTDDKVDVFVYGTLLRGQANHSHLAYCVFVGEAVTIDCFALYIDALPMAFQYDPVSPIHGELYRVSPARLAALDRLEGHPHMYRRSRVSVRVKEGPTVDAWLYFHLNPTGSIDPSGRYRG